MVVRHALVSALLSSVRRTGPRALRLFAAGVVLSSAAASASPIVYSQPVSYSGSWRASESANGVQVFWSYDNFTLSADRHLTGVTWWGAYVNYGTNTLPAPDTTAFEFRFYADAGSKPGNLLYAQSTSTFTPFYLGGSTVDGEPASVYRLSADLPLAFNAQGGTTYWLSIVSHSATYTPIVFAWGVGTGGDALSLQNGSGAAFQSFNTDRAFQLRSVPEPSSLALVTLAFGTLAIGRFRRR